MAGTQDEPIHAAPSRHSAPPTGHPAHSLLVYAGGLTPPHCLDGIDTLVASGHWRPYADGFDGLPRSPIERRLAVALIEAGAPRGSTQHVLFDRRGADGVDRPGTIADFAWPERRVAVFCDGWEHHSTSDQRAADAAKRDRARAHGWTVLSFWGGQIVRDADACARQILATLR